MVRAVLELLAPSRCLSCRRRGPMPWCARCAPPPRTDEPACHRCGAGSVGSRWTAASAGIETCPLAGSDVAEVVAAFDYRGAVAAAIRAAKLEPCPGAYGPLGRAVASSVVAHSMPDPDVVTSVPVPRRRRRRRGFDHAALLAQAVAADLHRPFVPLLAVAGRAPDRGAGGAGAVVAGMTACGSVHGHVLLVDDVVTTGATVRVAAAALVAAGATRVTVATVARAGGHPEPTTAGCGRGPPA